MKKLAGQYKGTTFLQDEGRRLTSFHFEMVEDQIIEFLICTYDEEMNRHEFVTMLDREQAMRIYDQLDAYKRWWQGRDDQDGDYA